MKNNNRKLIVIFCIIIAIFTIGIVNKKLENDTFFNISIGKYIIQNGIDMKDHFCYINDNLSYTYSHWAFDVIISLIYNNFGFSGVYCSTIFFSIIISITLFILLSKNSKSPIISAIITLISIYIIKNAFTARSQIVSFLCFIIEIYCIEKFIEKKQKRYPIILILLSIIVANFHAATWPLYLLLFLPYIASGILNICTLKNLYRLRIKKFQKKLSKLPNNSPKIEIFNKKIEDYKDLINESNNQYADYKIIHKEDYNIKNLVILLIIISFTGLITPIGNTPYTYILKSMFGYSNFENSRSIDYISEMQPLIPISNLAIIVYSVILISFLIFLPNKLKREHVFLVLGLFLMSLCSRRYVYLLVFIGSYALNDIITQSVNFFIKDDINLLEKICTSKVRYFINVIYGIFLYYQ